MPGSQNETAEQQSPPRSDEELMAAFARGSTESFEELFVRYRQPLFGFFRRRTADAARAEELTQDTFLAVLRGAARYQTSALFRTYLYAIGYKTLRAYRRKAAFRALFHGESNSEPSSPDAFDTSLIMRDALDRLDSVDREILLLREFEQLSYSDIAAVLDLPLNTVRSRLFRARTALRDLLSAPLPQAPQKHPAKPPVEEGL